MNFNDPHGFAPTSSTDHRSWIWVSAILSLVYSCVSLVARFTAKWELLWYDDILLGAGYVFALCHYGLLCSAIFNGLGASTTVLQGNELQTASVQYFAARIFLLLSLYFSKISLLVFTRRIFSGDMHKETVIFRAAYLLVCICGLAAVLLSSVGCDAHQVLIAREDVVGNANTLRWILITAFDSVTEGVLLAVSGRFLSKIRIQPSKKLVVMFAFAVRLAPAALSIAGTVSYLKFLHGTEDSIGIAPTVAWQEAILFSSLISASIPCLRPFLLAFMSRAIKAMYVFLYIYADKAESFFRRNGTSSEGNSRVDAIHLRTINNTSRRVSESQSGPLPARDGPYLRPDGFQYQVDVRRAGEESQSRDGAESQSVESDGSERMIIRRNVEIQVHREFA
ncbi:hypothetical protein LTR37_021447 [Vermiconidia calcicola]|uniref:Uncharacterized protein n=1 Tax=Vermiconidia calcicola TaxID=1690605 RepID=A0ACC3M9Q3_9PEZI|nr:hypothetical protein LTR37_021447 [Vermiconidia calcicola]